MNIEKILRLGQGTGFLAGALFAGVGVWTPTVLGWVSTIDLALATFALGFVGAAGAAYAGGRQRQAGLSALTAAAFLGVLIAPYNLGIVSATAVLVLGLLLWADSLANEDIYERIYN